MKKITKRKFILHILITIMVVLSTFSSVYADNEEENNNNDVVEETNNDIIEETNSDYVAKIDDIYYSSLNEAVIAATTNQIVEIIKPGTYTLPNIPNNIIVKGLETGVIFDCVNSVNICSTPNGVTFENVEFNMGQSSYHGFQDVATINMKNCIINGLFFSYWDMNLEDCTFNQTIPEYSMWLYRGNVSYKNCTFNGYGKFVNVYNEGGFQNKITVDSCTANNRAESGNKAVFNIKETCGDLILNSTVELRGENTYEGPAPVSADGKTVYNSFLQVEDFAEEKTGENGISIIVEEGTTINDERIESGDIYVTNPTVYEVDEEKEETINISEEKDVVFKVNVDFNKFKSVKIDNEEIEKDKAYKAERGSTIITIYYSYLKDLELGNHNLNIKFDDGYASTTFTIVRETKPTPTPTPTPSPSLGREVPNTGVER